MPMIDVEVPTPDGVAGATLHRPEGAGPWPAAVLYPDAASNRPVFHAMGDRLAAAGHVVLVPDLYYRAGGYEPLSIATLFSDRAEFARLRRLAGALTGPAVASDAVAFAGFLAARAEVADGPIGTTGYCMGGRLSLLAAAALGDRVGAAASFHGGRLAVEDDPDSPHLLAPAMRASIYVGAARGDRSFDAAEADRLHDALGRAGVDHRIETYAAAHGFAVPDNPTYDEAAAERHWQALLDLFAATLR